MKDRTTGPICRDTATHGQSWRVVTLESGFAFRVGPPLGAGGQAAVFLARTVPDDQPVAARYLRCADEVTEARFYREGVILDRLAELDAPNIVRQLAIGKDVLGTNWQLLELLDGDSADQIRDLGPAEPRLVAQWALDLARALASIHAAGIIHRDVKPGNVIIERDTNRAYLADFGLAKDLECEEEDLTLVGHPPGTNRYLAPELVPHGIARDGRADLWGLGAVMFEWLTGTRLWADREGIQILHRLSTAGRVPHVRTLAPGVPRDLARIAMRCLKVDPELRYQQADEVVRDLECFLGLRKLPRREVASRYATETARTAGIWIRNHAKPLLSLAAMMLVCIPFAGAMLQAIKAPPVAGEPASTAATVAQIAPASAAIPSPSPVETQTVADAAAATSEQTEVTERTDAPVSPTKTIENTGEESEEAESQITPDDLAEGIQQEIGKHDLEDNAWEDKHEGDLKLGIFDVPYVTGSSLWIDGRRKVTVEITDFTQDGNDVNFQLYLQGDLKGKAWCGLVMDQATHRLVRRLLPRDAHRDETTGECRIQDVKCTGEIVVDCRVTGSVQDGQITDCEISQLQTKVRDVSFNADLLDIARRPIQDAINDHLQSDGFRELFRNDIRCFIESCAIRRERDSSRKPNTTFTDS